MFPPTPSRQDTICDDLFDKQNGIRENLWIILFLWISKIMVSMSVHLQAAPD